MSTSLLPPYLQDFTSLDTSGFVYYTNEIGWKLNGAFATLLATVGYSLHKKWGQGRVVPRRSGEQVGIALNVLILEL